VLFTINLRELQQAINGLKEEEKEQKLAEILSNVVAEFEGQIIDIAKKKGCQKAESCL